MNWRLWSRGLVAAILGGLAGGVSVWTVDPIDFNLESGLTKLCKVAFVNALISAAAYLKQHPDPWEDIMKGGRHD